MIPKIVHVGFYIYHPGGTPSTLSELVAEIYNGNILGTIRLECSGIKDYERFAEEHLTRLFTTLTQDPQVVVLHPGVKNVDGEGRFHLPDNDWLQTFANGAVSAVSKQRYKRSFLIDSIPICLDKFNPYNVETRPTLKPGYR